jgi:ribA/ribD-fused uncharacterized protein
MNISDVKDKFNQGDRIDYLFFWSHRSNPDGSIGKTCLSQWFDASFEIDGIHYQTAEHYMMAEKARLFDDPIVLTEILAATHPRQVQILGQKIQKFQETVWQEHRFQIVVNGNIAKFQQNPLLKEFILSTKDQILVEASPDDKIWGIGLSFNDPNIEDPNCWQGLNLLGFALMEARASCEYL